MQGRDIYAQILGIRSPWAVVDVTMDAKKQEVVVSVEAGGEEAFRCMACDVVCPKYDVRRRRWRHLDTCQYKTILEADVPRVECKEHGVQQVAVPWAEPNSRFTALFEALVIDWLKEASISAVARMTRLSWNEVDGVMSRAVRRGLARRDVEAPTKIGVDETSFQKRHEYVTIVTNLEGTTVVHVADDRRAESLAAYFEKLTPDQRAKIAVVAMDMHGPYISATRNAVPDADDKIVFDKFHVAKHLGDAVDKVRRDEHRRLLARGDWSLKSTKHLWLQNPDSMDDVMWDSTFKILRDANLQTSRAWAIKETAMSLWGYASRTWATKAWRKWIGWARRSRLEPMKKAATTVCNHLRGIVNAVILRATNAASESINSQVQKVKRMACGFRNRSRFRNAIYFHLGDLNLYPAPIAVTHTKP
jgi:transposase